MTDCYKLFGQEWPPPVLQSETPTAPATDEGGMGPTDPKPPTPAKSQPSQPELKRESTMMSMVVEPGEEAKVSGHISSTQSHTSHCRFLTKVKCQCSAI